MISDKIVLVFLICGLGSAVAQLNLERLRAATRLEQLHLKRQEFSGMLAAPIQWEIQRARGDYHIEIQHILHSSVSVATETTLNVDVTVQLKGTSESCRVRGLLDLTDVRMYTSNAECGDSRILFVPAHKLNDKHPVANDNNLNVTKEFQQFHEKFGPSEASIVLDGGIYRKLHRYSVFAKNLVRMAWLNALDQGSAVYGITEFSDLSHAEFNQFYTMQRPTVRNLLEKRRMTDASQQALIPDPSKVPESFDWREHDAVTKVKNQGMCGSCWSFSTTGNIEGVHKVDSGDLVSLSEQELVDCDKVDQGCQGGLMDNAFDAVQSLGGLEPEADYEYTGHAQESCKFDATKVAVTISGHHDIAVGDEVAMQAQLLKTGPLAVALNAMWMQFYRHGVSHPWRALCNPKALDHGVLVVGYGVEPAHPDHLPFPKKTQDYWIVKNSWGPGWGEKGYYRIFRGDGTCGIDQYATTALP